jgi:hypothetical protein
MKTAAKRIIIYVAFDARHTPGPGVCTTMYESPWALRRLLAEDRPVIQGYDEMMFHLIDRCRRTARHERAIRCGH